MDPNVSTLRTEITTVNGNYTLTSPCDSMYIILTFLNGIFALAGLAGNGIVLWLLGFQMHRNAFTVYVFNLAGADFLFLCVQLVYFISVIIYLFHSVFIDIPVFIHMIFIFTYLAGLSILSAISAERCLSVLWPIWYRCKRPTHTSAVMCALLWATSLLFSLLERTGCGFLFNNVYDWCPTLHLTIAAWVVILFVVLSGSSLTLLVRVFCGSRRIPVTRLYVTISLTVLSYLFFGLPFGISNFLLTWIINFNDAFFCDVYFIIMFLSSVNSCANPIIYFFLGSIRHHRVQRQSLKLILQRALQDTPEKEDCLKRGSVGKPVELQPVRCSS